ncbi:MAG: pantoate--beta-alanine ligase [Prevotellaceae bacterium]|jgi:pantoate--beta-alanine ligase|nr:pantoate--beta-alanine ligase [Prevotellaceae bacterium]
MQIISKISDLQTIIAKTKSENKAVGFVPTMGALHSGHLSLVVRSAAENDLTVVSIFVNPTQFNDKNDLKNYPRTLDADCELLETAGCNIVFAPSVEEMYPTPDTRKFDFGTLETVMEGAFRPGHFNGVAQIVSKLFDAVQPTRAYFGEKDFQQVAIIKKMVEMLQYPLQIVVCPIVREESGLAKSSRNELLSAEERKKAAIISRTLTESRNFVPEKSVANVKAWVIAQINAVLEVEYFEIVDGNTLQPIADWAETDFAVGCVAAYCGKVRLIDNIKY